MRVKAPHFVAGLVVEGGRVTEAAPILAWSLGKGEDFLRAYFKRKGWQASRVPETKTATPCITLVGRRPG